MPDDATRLLLETLVDGQSKAVDRLAELTETTLTGFGEVRTAAGGHAAQLEATSRTLETHVTDDKQNFALLHADIGTLHKRITREGCGDDDSGKGKRWAAWGGLGTLLAAVGTWLAAQLKGQ